jgi:hypothetical protein
LNVITALSVFAALAALVTVGAELLLRVTTKRSAINNRKLFIMISFFNCLDLLAMPFLATYQEIATHVPIDLPLFSWAERRVRVAAAKSFPTGGRNTAA